MIGGELNIKLKPLEEQRDFLLEQNMLLTGKIATLEKENAELKDYRLTTVAKQQTDLSKYALNLEHKLSWYDDQLTKAKELLAKWVELYKPKSKTAIPTPIQVETEQFLNEVNK